MTGREKGSKPKHHRRKVEKLELFTEEDETTNKIRVKEEESSDLKSDQTGENKKSD